MTNLKLVLRTYSALRQMSPDDIALLETLRGLNDGDRELMVETLQGKATGRKAGKKSSTSKSSQSQQSSSKSSRASGIHAQLKERRQEQQRISTEDVDAAFCAAPNCGEGLTNPIHDPNGGYGSYHPFVGNVPPAPAPSPANGAESATDRSTRRSVPSSTLGSNDGTERNALLSGASSEASTVSAQAATGGSGE